MMKDYKFSMAEEPLFVNEDQQSNNEKVTRVRFKVLGIKWIERDRGFQMLATLAVNMVYMDVELKRNVALPPDQLDPRNGLLLRRNIILCLLKEIARIRCSEEFGYYIAVTKLNSVDDGQVNDLTGEVIFPASFKCITMKPYVGEIYIGTTDKVQRHGIFLKAGPLQNIFLSEKMMKDYKFRRGDESMFVSINEQSKMENGTKVKFRVMGLKWVESDREFQVLATIAGDFLGPV